MFSLRTKTDWKYFYIELGLLLFVCYISAIISDIEYSYYEEKNVWNFASAVEYRVVYGTFSFLLYGSYYWFLLKPFVFKKQFVYLLLSVIAFVAVYHLENKYENWLVYQMPFLSAKLRARAQHDYKITQLFFIISYALGRLVFTFIGFAFLIRSLQQDEQMKTMKEQQLISELNFLKAQIHPHFFFNTINNIYSLALKQSADTAPMVAKLGEMMRYILYEADQKTVLLTREIEFLDNYIGVEKIRHHKTQSIQFDVQGVTWDVFIEPLLLLPFIENAFKHGLQEETANGFVNIIICLTEGDLTLEVTNSKPVLKTAAAGKGLGLQNVIKRLDILYPDRYQLDVADNTDSHQVLLTLSMV